MSYQSIKFMDDNNQSIFSSVSYLDAFLENVIGS